jgi:tetratricopeptide (TPR) repeat protein
MIRLSAIVVLLTVGAPLDARAGDVVAYGARVRLYRSGRGQDATTQLAAWPHDDVASAVKAAAAAWTSAERIVAAILHADTANVLVDARPDDAALLIDTGYALVQAAGPAPFGAERGDVTPRRWYYVVASMLISATRIDGPEGAVRIVHQGRLAFPRDANLLFVRGTLIEMRIQTLGSFTGLRNELPGSPSERRRFEDIAKGAIDDYQRALTINPHMANAQLHIGWLRLFIEDRRRARLALEAALADADSDTVRYLAHLFLGGVAERDKRFDDARREYEAAFEIGAGYQAACVALSRAEERAGQSSRAREISQQCVQLSAHEDPWSDYRIKFDRDALYELRAEARQR